MPRAAFAITVKDLRRRIRDRTAIIVGLILPFTLAGIFSLTLGGADETTFTAAYAIADADGGHLATSFRELLTTLDFVTLRDARDVQEAERLAADGDVAAAFVFPEGFTATVQAGGGGRLEVIGSPSSPTGALIARSLADSFAARLDAVAVAVTTVRRPASGPAELARVADEARRIPAAAVVTEGTADARTFSATTFFAIGMAVFFLFFTVEFGVRGLLEERQDGTLARLLVAPVPPSAILSGKALAGLVVGLVATVLLVLSTSLLLDATWGPPIGVAMLVVSGVLAAVGVTALVATLARTPAQAGSYASIVAVVGGLLGGTFFPISQAPGALAALRFLSPQGWLMEGFERMASGDPVAAALPAVAGALAFAIVCGAAAWRRATSMVAR